MTNKECRNEKISARMAGVFILLASVLLAFIGMLIVPVFGLFFAVPLLILGLTFLLAPESNICGKLLRKNG